jgi:hypothetical protein
MSSRMPETVDQQWLVDGYLQSVGRFQGAATADSAEDAFHALFEALSWAASLDELLGFPDDSPVLRGLRFARNRVHHQWANALWLDPGGAEFPMRLPFAFFEWRWRGAEQLPPGRNVRGRPVYQQHLAGRPARRSLDAVADYFREHEHGHPVTAT